MRESTETIKLQSEWLARIVAAYLWEEMWWLCSFARRWWCLQWGSRGLFNINKIKNPNLGRWNTKRFAGPDGGSWYVNFLRVYLLHTIFVWGVQYLVGKVYSISTTLFEGKACCWQPLAPQKSKKTSFRASKWPRKFGTRKSRKKKLPR